MSYRHPRLSSLQTTPLTKKHAIDVLADAATGTVIAVVVGILTSRVLTIVPLLVLATLGAVVGGLIPKSRIIVCVLCGALGGICGCVAMTGVDGDPVEGAVIGLFVIGIPAALAPRLASYALVALYTILLCQLLLEIKDTTTVELLCVTALAIWIVGREAPAR